MVCATCRKLIALGATAYRCSVASCNAGRMKLRFCSVACWEKHVPTARHRKASWIAEDRAGAESAPTGPEGSDVSETSETSEAGAAGNAGAAPGASAARGGGGPRD